VTSTGEKPLWEQETVGSLMEPLSWFTGAHMARTVGDLGTKRSLFLGCLLNDTMYLRAHHTIDEEHENCTEAAISALVQSSSFLFSQVSSGHLTQDQLRTKIEEFITR